MAAALPIFEMGIAGALVVPGTRVGAGWAAVALLGVFSGATGLRLMAGERPPCACFGTGNARPISGGTLVRNAVLVALAVLATG